MKKTVAALMAVCALFAPWAAFAAAGKDAAAAKIDEVMELSGINAQIVNIPELLQQQMADQNAPLEPRARERLEAIFAESYSAAAFHREIGKELLDHYDEKRFNAFIEMLRSPLVRKMTELEVAASSAAAQQEMMEFAQRLQQTPPPLSRILLIRRMIEATEGVDAMVNAQTGMFRAFAAGVDPMMPPDKRLKEGQLDEIIGQMETQMRPAAQQWLELNGLYTYREVPDEELIRYVDLYDTETGRWIMTLLNDAVQKSYATLSAELGRRMGKEIATPPAAP